MHLSKLRNVIRTTSSFFNPIFYNGKIIRKLPYASVSSRLIVCPEKKILYIRIPKAANSTVTALLWNQIHGTCFDEHTPTKKIKKSFQKAVNLNFIRSLDAKKNYFFFTIVRNPYDRILSAYLQKISFPLYNQRYGKQIAQAGNGEISFSSFCKFLDQKGLYKDPHWIPQYDFIWPNCKRLNFIGRFENFQEDVSRLFFTLFGECNVNLNAYYGPGRTNANELRHFYYDEQSKNIIYRLYQSDFLYFNYSSDL